MKLQKSIILNRGNRERVFFSKKRLTKTVIFGSKIMLSTYVILTFSISYPQMWMKMPKNVDYSRNHTYVEIVENSLTEELNETPEVKKVALTFDDGPHPIYTKEVLEVLRRRKIHATFFLIGEYAEVYPEIVKQIKEDGHVIGNHTYSHTVFQNDNLEDYLEECEKTSNLIEEITGEPTSYFRPPCGKSSKVLEKRLAMAQVLWTVDPLDWSIQNRGEIARKVMTQTKENDMILLHDEYETTVEALEDIIEGLEKRGFVFVTVDEIIMD